MTDKAGNIRSEPPERSILFLTSSRGSLPLILLHRPPTSPPPPPGRPPPSPSPPVINCSGVSAFSSFSPLEREIRRRLVGGRAIAAFTGQLWLVLPQRRHIIGSTGAAPSSCPPSLRLFRSLSQHLARTISLAEMQTERGSADIVLFDG